MLRGLKAGARDQGPGARSNAGVWKVGGACWPLAPGPWPLFLLLSALAHAAIFPDQIGTFKKGAPRTMGIPDQALYNEYGLDTTEQAEFESADRRFTATAWRLKDSTGAMALFEARRPSGATASKITPLAVQTSDGMIFAYGNYVFQLTGAVPGPADLQPVFDQLPKLEQSPLPTLMNSLPKEGLIPNSERYILGPVSLDRFQGGIPPSVAAFHLGSEAQSGRYRTSKGTLTLAIFKYPTPNLARVRSEEFQKIPGLIAKRSGPLVAVVLRPPDADAAERVLGQVRYDAQLTWNEKVPGEEFKQFSGMILSMFVLAGILIFLSTVAGIGFGGFRILMRKLGQKQDPNAMIVLDLRDK